MCADIVNHEEEVISVGQLNQQAKRLLENQFRGVTLMDFLPWQKYPLGQS